MHQIKFYPVGNGDTSQIILENGKRLLFDFRHRKQTETGEKPGINLKEYLQDELKNAGCDYYDVVAFTHSDNDHIENSTEFFELRFAKEYQGEGRTKINELWVPAAMICEECSNDQRTDEFVLWRQEARYRLKEGTGIRVFSKPEKLKSWLEENGLTIESRRHLITDAGQLVPSYSLASDGVEFFCHSPFIEHVDGAEILRNEAALIFNIRFNIGSVTIDYLAVGDCSWEILEDIVRVTKGHHNYDRLAWDLYNIPHHCSYLALSDKKETKETKPKELVEELLLSGKAAAYIISSSNPIDETEEAEKQDQPPHIQAKRCYERYLKKVEGTKFLITMEEPTRIKPEPIIFNIDRNGIARGGKLAVSAASVVISSPAPRAGSVNRIF